MEKRSRRRTRDLVTQAALQGLSQNEIGCARISIMARSKNAPRKRRGFGLAFSFLRRVWQPRYSLDRLDGASQSTAWGVSR
jgi:hypothetical protein